MGISSPLSAISACSAVNVRKGMMDRSETREARDLEGRLKARLRVLGGKDDRDERQIDEGPCCAYGLVTRALLDELAKDVEEIKGRVNTLLWGMGAAVLLDVVMRLAGR